MEALGVEFSRRIPWARLAVPSADVGALMRVFSCLSTTFHSLQVIVSKVAPPADETAPRRTLPARRLARETMANR
jgi:hypothetical protein